MSMLIIICHLIVFVYQILKCEFRASEKYHLFIFIYLFHQSM